MLRTNLRLAVRLQPEIKPETVLTNRFSCLTPGRAKSRAKDGQGQSATNGTYPTLLRL